MEYDKKAHRLLRDIAHRARLTPEEYPEFEDAVRAAGIEVLFVDIPEWPPVPYAPLLIRFGAAAWWEGRYWTGEQPAVSRWQASDANRIAREMAGDALSPPRLAYAWQCPEFDEREHIILRYWLEEYDLSIVDFLVSYLPAAKSETGQPHTPRSNAAMAEEVESTTSGQAPVEPTSAQDSPSQPPAEIVSEAPPLTFVQRLDGVRDAFRSTHQTYGVSKSGVADAKVEMDKAKTAYDNATSVARVSRTEHLDDTRDMIRVLQEHEANLVAEAAA